MLVKDRMTPNPMTITPATSFPEAFRIIHDKEIRHLPVVDEDDKLVGVVTQTDLLHASPSEATTLTVFEMSYLLANLHIQDVMSSPAVTVAEDDPLEEAAAYQQLAAEFGLTQQQIADKVGKNRVSVANALRLLRLPDFCKSMLAGGQISEGHARALLGLEDDEEMMERALKAVIKQHLSVRQTEEMVRRLRTGPPSPKATRTVAPETRALEDEFSQALGTKVSLSRSKKGGRLTIHFFSEEELHGLYQILVRRASD